MTSAWGWMLPAVVILFLLSFLFSGLEAALFSFGRYRLRELCADCHTRALRLSSLFEKPGRLVSILVILNTTANVLLTIIWTRASFMIAENSGIGSKTLFVAGMEFILLLLIVLFAEITPKTLFSKYAEPISLAFTPFMIFLWWVVWVFAWFFEGIANILLFPIKKLEKGRNNSVTEEEIIDLVTVGESEGVLDEHEKEMIHSIFEFGDRTVKEVMVPRTDIEGLELNAPILEAMKAIVRTGFSRIPVYEGSIDSISGILMAKDVLPLVGKGSLEDKRVIDVMKGNVYFIPETKPLRELFDEFQRRKVQMAVAVDEHGGTAGIITTEDMLEEIVGEIQDEHDKVEEPIQLQEDGSFIMEGRIPLHELEELFEIEIDEEDIDTVGGLILSLVGDIPPEGLMVDDDKLSFQVLKVEGHRVTKLKAWKKEGIGNGEESG